MQNYESVGRFMSEDAVTVLTVTVAFAPDMSDSVRSFYKSLADEFGETAKKRIYPRALEAYRECTDRRKKYRYSPWRAEFSVSQCDKNGYHLRVSSNGEALIDEVHTWKDDGITKRKIIKMS